MGGGPPKIPSNHINEINGSSSQPPFNHYGQHSSHFSGTQPSMTYEHSPHEGSHPMYPEDENCSRSKSNMIYQPMSTNSYPQHQHEGFNQNYQSQLDHVSSGSNIQGQHRNPEYEGPRQSYSPPSQSGNFQYRPRHSPPRSALQGHHSPSFYQASRSENYSNSQGEEWNSGGYPSQHRPIPPTKYPLMLSR